MKVLLALLVSTTLAFNLRATEAIPDTKLSYQSFIDYTRAGKVISLEISKYGINDMTAVIDKDGKDIEFLIDKPYQPSDDIIFIEFLKKNKVKFEILEKNHASSRNMWSSILPALGIFILPCLLAIVPIILVVVTMIRTGRIERILETMQSNTPKNS